MGFFQSISSCFRQYVTFSGRACRSEFWYFVLFCALIVVPAALLGAFGAIVLVPVVIPAISVEVRRLHDLDKSGWWFWIGLVPIIGVILKLVWYVGRGTDGENRFGPDPLAGVPINTHSAAPIPSTTSMTEKAEQLAKIKSLLESGTVTQEEFNRMKGEVLGS